MTTTSFETNMIFIFLIIIGLYLLFKKISSNGWLMSQEEKNEIIDRQQEVMQLVTKRDSSVEKQYLDHFYRMSIMDSDFVPDAYREYFKKEYDLFYGSSKAVQKQRLKTLKSFNHPGIGWECYTSAFACERMIKDRECLPNILSLGMYNKWQYAVHPTESAIELCRWYYWKRTHYPALIERYNKTGEFIPGWDWKPLAAIPDYHNNT